MTKYLQTEFNTYHENIKLKNTEDNSILREKRDMLVQELEDYFEKKAEREGTAKITFVAENQGSYSMGTGVKPLSGEDYDIDLMILFNISKDDYTPVQVKRWVYEALDKQFRTVEYKNPCVRVQYHKDSEEYFHVDLALYANGNDDGKKYLSRGKPTSATKDKVWEVSEPKKLKRKVNGKFSDSDDRQQMKRIIRYLKRWKDLKFNSQGNGKPTGIAFTALALSEFNPVISRDSFSSSVDPDDLSAFENIVDRIISKFGFWNKRITTKLPVEPMNDLFERLTDNQHIVLKEKLEKLKERLTNAKNEPDPHEASKLLRKELGEDFPLVEKDKSGQKRALAFPGKSESA